MSTTERTIYKVLRNVGVKKNYISHAETIEDLYLDDFDFQLLVYYFENEFNLNLNEKEITKLTSLIEVNKLLNSKKVLNKQSWQN